MADVEPVLGSYEAQLQKDIDRLEHDLNDSNTGVNVLLAAEEKKVSGQQAYFDKERADHEKALLQATFGAAIGEGLISGIEALREQLAELEKAYILAKDHSPDAIYGTTALLMDSRASYIETVNLDNAIVDWVNALRVGTNQSQTSQQQSQANFEEFLFDHVIKRKPPKIGKAPEYKPAFETQNWPVIINIFREEYLALEELLAKYEAGLRNLVGVNLSDVIFLKQPDKTLLESLKAQKARLDNQQSEAKHRMDRFQALYAVYLERWLDKPGLATAEAEKNAARDAQRAVELEEEEAKKKQEEQPIGVASGERIVQTPVPEKKSVEQTKPGSVVQAQERRTLEEIGARQLSWRAVVHSPSLLVPWFRDFFVGSWERTFSKSKTEQPVTTPPETLTPPPAKPQNIWQRLTGRFVSKKDLKLAGKVGGESLKKAGKETGKVVTGEIKKKSWGMLIKGALGAIPGAGQVIAAIGLIWEGAKLVKKLLSSKEMRDLMLNAGVGTGLAVYVFIQALLSNAIVIGFSAAGALTGMALGALAGGPIGSLIGFGLGGVSGAAIGYVVSSSFGFGAGFGSAVATAPVASAATIGGAGALGTGTGAVGAAASGGFLGISGLSLTSLLGGGALPVIASVAATAVGSLVVVISTWTAFGTVAATSQQADLSKEEGTLFTLEKTVDQTSVAGGTSATVTFSLKITAGKDNDISIVKVDDKFTRENNASTPLKLSANPVFPPTVLKGDSTTVMTSYTTTAADNNSNLVNIATVTVKAGDKEETLTAEATVAVGSPNYTASRCPVAPIGNACSVANLSSTFTSDQVENASRICYRESGGKSTKTNDGCNDGTNRHNEYSVGIFQINLFAHDYLCKEIPGGKNPFLKPYCGKDCGDACDRDENLLKQCADYWRQDDHNAAAAARLSNNGQTWKAWSTAKPQYCNIP
ncbi:hypothetical protein M1403_02460 [Patescibacteria group bacterium]|nr:hypothetical protein [Patescibacteria group bacterium]